MEGRAWVQHGAHILPALSWGRLLPTRPEQRLAADIASRFGFCWRMGNSIQGARGDEEGAQTRLARPTGRFRKCHRPRQQRRGLRRSHGLAWRQQDNGAGMGLVVLETRSEPASCCLHSLPSEAAGICEVGLQIDKRRATETQHRTIGTTRSRIPMAKLTSQQGERRRNRHGHDPLVLD